MSEPRRAARIDANGRAFAGSQLQMQLYVDRHRSVLDRAIREATGLVGELEWVSPVRKAEFREFKDAPFLHALRLENLTQSLRAFWPTSGPRWDGLARVEGYAQPTVV